MARKISGNINNAINEDMFEELEKETNDIVNTEVEKEVEKPTPKPPVEKKPSNKTTKKMPPKNPIIAGQSVVGNEKDAIIASMKEQFLNISDKIVVDLNNITINDSLNDMEKVTNYDIIFNSRPSYQVQLSQSCYQGFIESLKLPEISSLKNSTLDPYNYRLKLYQLVYNKLQTTSLGKIDFDTFLSITSLLDLNTLYYGIYMQTFPGSSSFNFTCGHCKGTFESNVPNDSLISSKDENIYERMNEISMKSRTAEEVKEGSLVFNTTRVLLNESKTIIDIKTPSLNDQLVGLRSVPANKIEETTDMIYDCIFIKSINLLNIPATIESGRAQYYSERNDFKVKYNILTKLSINDATQLSDAITERIDKYQIDYKIKSFECPKCHKEMGEVAINMEDLLFQKLFRQ